MLYRIFTEDVNRRGIIRILDAEFTGYTVMYGRGSWMGAPEASLIIEVVGARLMRRIRTVAQKIKTLNKQKEVLIQWIRNHTTIV